MSDPPNRRKKGGLLGVFRGRRKRSKSREPPTTSTQDGSVPTRTSGGHTDERRGSFETGPIYGVGQHQDPLLSPHKSPTILVEDRSVHNYGSTYSNSHSVHGTANYIGSVTNAALGANSVTTIERAFFSNGNAALLWDSLPKQRDIDMSGQQNEYLEGSREETVQDVLGWGKDPNLDLSLFIHGPAGLGKSTLARHLTHRLHVAGLLAASVSLNALPSDSRGPESVVKMISREIGETYPSAIPSILEAIKACKGAPLVDHVERYIIGPVRSLRLSHPLIVLFDAIDEWESHAALLKALSSLVPASTSVKFILLGRSDPRARGFKDISIRPYPLQPVPTAIMAQYLAKQFDDVNWGHGRRPAPWRITQLAELANGLFIWATVVCSLLQKRLSRLPPEDILDSILAARRSLGDSEQLATLYHQAIMWLFPDCEDRDLFREYLSATLALQEPLPIADFAGLTNLPIRAIQSLQLELKALQIRQVADCEGDPTVYPAGTLFHQSFLDYLESDSTPPHAAFHTPLLDAHAQLAQCCLTVLPHFLPGSHPIDPLRLSPKHTYIVRYLATHIHRGTPSVRLGSAVGWEGTRVCQLLQQIGSKTLFRWGSLFICLVKPGSMMEEGCYGDGEMGRLMQDIAGVLRSHSPEVIPLQIPCLEVAVRLQPWSAGIWDALGWAYYQLAKYTKDTDAGDKAVLAHQNALYIVEESESSDRASAFYSLATSLYTRFELLGNTQDLDHSISLHQEALNLRPPGHANRAYSLGNLANALVSSSEIGGSMSNIDKIIHLEREALDLCPPGHKDRGASLQNLSASLQSRSETTASTTDLDEAVQLCREVLELRPPGHAGHVTALKNLAYSLHSRFQSMPSTTDLDEAVRLRREVLELCPLGHADHVAALESLAVSLQSRSETASTADLDEAVRLSREVLELRPPGHADRAAALLGLAASLLSRFETTAFIIDLDESIRLRREILEYHQLDHADHAGHLNDLAWELTLRYEAKGLIENLEEAISLGRRSLSILPIGHPDRPYTLDTLAKALHFKPEHLDEALQLSRESVSVTPSGNRQGWERRMTHATILLRHYESSGSVEELRQAISVCEGALSECPPDHILRPKLLDLQAKLAEAKSRSPSQP